MIYMGITSSDQASIRSTKGARSADRSVPGDLCVHLGFQQDINRSRLSSPSSFSLAFYSGSTHTQTLLHNYTVPHVPSEDRRSQMIHQSLALRKWSSALSTGGRSHIYADTRRWSSLLKFPVAASSVGAVFRSDPVKLWLSPNPKYCRCRAQFQVNSVIRWRVALTHRVFSCGHNMNTYMLYSCFYIRLVIKCAH